MLISVDLDDVSCYHAIHGLGAAPDRSRGAVLERCLPRFLDLFADTGTKATFFVIGRDLERDREEGGRGADLLRRALADGHELGNHGHEHAYDMVRWSDDQILADLRRCDELLRELGATVTGFRAPGYTHDDRLLRQVAAMEYAYDSSALPSPPYYLARLAAIGSVVLRGRRSQSMARGVGSFLGPRKIHFRQGLHLWEIPISVSKRLRLPHVGTLMLGGPPWLSKVLLRSAERCHDLHVELHGIDLADADNDGYAPELVRRQPGLGVPLAVREQRLRELLAARGPGRTIASAL
jgi:peptidoglycan/xylan/chitin deacetylase (PgdA/CDA1 family)